MLLPCDHCDPFRGFNFRFLGSHLRFLGGGLRFLLSDASLEFFNLLAQRRLWRR